MNILPEKHCNFDCLFCPIVRSQNKVDIQKPFDKIDSSLIELESMIENTKAKLIVSEQKEGKNRAQKCILGPIFYGFFR